MVRRILVILVTKVIMQTCKHTNGSSIRSEGNHSNHRIIRNRDNMVTIETRGKIINPITTVIVLT